MTSTTFSPDLLDRLRAQAHWTRALALRLVGDPDEAEDIVQESWIAALRRPPAEGPLRAWLATVVRNLVRDRYRQRQRADRRERQSQEVGGPAAAVPDTVLAEAQAHRTLMDHVLALADPYRETLLLRYFDDRSSAEIARAQGIPEGTVRWRLKTALDQLRVRLDEENDGDRERWRRALLPLLPAGALERQPRAHGRPIWMAVPAIVLLGALAALVAVRFTGFARTGHVPTAARTIAAGTVANASAAFPVAVPTAEPQTRLRGGVVFAGAVMDASAGPIAGAVVELTGAMGKSVSAPVGRPGVAARAVTAADGTFSVTVEPASYGVIVTASGYEGKGAQIDILGDENHEIALMPLQPPTAQPPRAPGRPLSGRVLGAEGQSLPAAYVWWHAGGPTSNPYASDGHTTADRDGRFSFADVPPGPVVVRADAEGHTTSDAVPADPSRPIEVHLRRGLLVRGRVLAANGDPVAGVELSLRVRADDVDGRILAGTGVTSASDGRFATDRLPPGQLTIEAQKLDMGTARLGPLALPTATEITVRFAAGATIEGRVVTETGAPAAMAHVSWESPAGPGGAQAPEATADREGRFRLGPLAPGAGTLRATWPSIDDGYTVTTVGGWAPDRRDRTALTLAAGHRQAGVQLVLRARDKRIEGTISDSAGRPIDGARIQLQPDTSADDWVSELPHRSAMSAPDGRFVFGGLAAGSYIVIVSHPAHPETRVRAVKASARNLRVQLRDPAAISGLVVDERDRPAPAFTVVAVPAPDPGKVQISMGTLEGFRTSDTDGHGGFTITALPPGRFELYATAPGLAGHGGWIQLTEGEQRTAARIHLGPAVSARGRVVDGDGHGRAGVQVALSGTVDKDWVWTDANGAFTLTGLVPGRTIHLAPFADRMLPLETARPVTVPARGTVEIPPLVAPRR